MTQITDAATINRLSEQIGLESPAAPVAVATEAPADNRVFLPGGYVKADGTLVKYVEVRELNGLDEEAIAKSGGTAKALLTILSRGLVAIDGERPTKEDLEALLSGDRDAIMLGIRKVTFGNTADMRFYCPTCNDQRVFKVDLAADVEIKDLENPVEDRSWIKTIKQGDVRLALPTGVTQRKVMEATDKTTAELNTLILSGCVLSVNGLPTTPATVLNLGIADRDALIVDIMERNPGPRLMEVTKACEACGNDVELPLSLAALFRL